MKYKWKIAILIILFFVASQLVGLAVTASYKENFYKKEREEKIPKNLTNLSEKKIPEENFTNISITREVIPEKIEIKTTFDFLQILISFLIALIFATLLFIILMKVGVIRVVRFWLFFVVSVGLFLCFSLLFYNLNFKITIKNFSFNFLELFVLLAAIGLAYYKIYRRNIILHNITEIFVYPGIVILFLPIVNLYIALALLLILSVYDFIAVFKTKHMQKMAKFMVKDIKAFTGFFLPWLDKAQEEKIKKLKKLKSKKLKKVKLKVNVAALGGGDIILPMLFICTVFLNYGLINSLLIIFFSSLALLMLMVFGEKEKAYPALPPLTLGCLFGYLVGLFL